MLFFSSDNIKFSVGVETLGIAENHDSGSTNTRPYLNHLHLMSYGGEWIWKGI